MGQILLQITVLFLLSIFRRISANCPYGCVCANNLIICTCQGSANTSLVLQPFHGIDYISKVYIHTCKQLTIPSDTFAGLAIAKELSVSAIDDLRFEPFAFREMQKYPEKVTFGDCGIAEIPENTFAGLNKATHLWFRNASITTIRSYAFRDVSRLDYLYFRESTIRRIQAAAFGEMFYVSHVFIRGRIHIGGMSDHLFRDSRIGEVVFEEATIKSLDVLSFSGIRRFNNFKLINCTILDTSLPPRPTYPYKAITSGGKLEFTKTNMEELYLGPFSNVTEIKFYQSRIQELKEYPKAALQNVTLLHFSKTLINYIVQGSLAEISSIRDLLFDECAIDTIFPDSFRNSRDISYLLFLNTRFIEFRQFAFRALSVGTFILDGCQVERVFSESFTKIKAWETLKIINSKIGTFQSRAFYEAQTGYFGLQENTIENFTDFSLADFATSEANISNNFFENVGPRSFGGLLTIYSLFSQNRFICACNSKFAPLFAMTDELPRWGFGPNFCFNPHSNITSYMSDFRQNCKIHTISLEPVALTQDLVCHEMALLTKCSCQNRANVWQEISGDNLASLHKLTTQLWIKDCQAIKVRENSLARFSALSVLKFDVENLQLYSGSFGASNQLRVIEISHAEIPEVSGGSFVGLRNLEFLTFSEITVKNLKPNAFSGLRVKNFVFRNCKISNIHDGFISGRTEIENFTVSSSRLGILKSGALENSVKIQRITFENNHIVSIEKNALETFSNHLEICFASNYLACQCNNQGFLEILDKNFCKEAQFRNYCFEPDSEKNKGVEDVLFHLTRPISAIDKQFCASGDFESHSRVPSQKPNGATASNNFCFGIILFYPFFLYCKLYIICLNSI